MHFEDQDIRTVSGCAKPLNACAVIAGLMIVAVMGMLIWILRMPGARALRGCRANMVELHEALDRYHDVNGVYPSRLEDLEGDYLKDNAVLRCPLDESGDGRPSYGYHQPQPNSPKTFVVLECDRHRLWSDAPATTLKLLKNGEVKAGPPPNEASRGQER